MKTMFKTLGAIIALAAVAAAPALAADDPLAREVKELVQLLPGTYHNGVQADAEVNMNVPADKRLGRRTQVFAHVEKPTACCTGFTPGPDAAYFFMQIYRDGEYWSGGDHIVVVYPDRKLDTLVWQFIRVADPKTFADLHRDAQKQRNVTLIAQPQDVLDCPVLGRKVGPHTFQAQLKNGGCDVISRVSGKKRRLEMSLTLTPENLLYLDRGIENGKVVHGAEDGTHFAMARIPLAKPQR